MCTAIHDYMISPVASTVIGQHRYTGHQAHHQITLHTQCNITSDQLRAQRVYCVPFLNAKFGKEGLIHCMRIHLRYQPSGWLEMVSCALT